MYWNSPNIAVLRFWFLFFSSQTTMYFLALFLNSVFVHCPPAPYLSYYAAKIPILIKQTSVLLVGPKKGKILP